MAKNKSEFLFIGDMRGHVAEIECVPSIKKPREMFFRFDGTRIAYRGHPDTDQAKTWVTLVRGFEVVDVDDKTIAVYYEGTPQ